MDDFRISKYTKINSPENIKKYFHAQSSVVNFIYNSRQNIIDIINNTTNKKLIIVGPCSIHNPEEAIEYGKCLKKISNKFSDKLLVVMRVYFEKPRTTIGWKGLINDPDLDGSYNINKGIVIARKLLLDLNTIKIPVASELLDTIIPQYINDLVSWGAIGARTVESQVHREMVSGVSFPVGFKNNINGDVQVAIDAVKTAETKHCFIGITKKGEPSVISTTGNANCHVILRGSKNGTNYKSYKEYNKVIVDCSHGNSEKDYTKQKDVVDYLCKNGAFNSSNFIGIMLESNINEGSQKLDCNNPQNLKHGVSITDSCISLNETEELLQKIYDQINTQE